MYDWALKQVLIIGAARQGLALARYLVGRGASVILTDRRPADQMQAEQDSLAGLEIQWALGGHPPALLDGCDWVCPSGGVPLTLPLVVEALQRGIPLTNDSQVFLEVAPCPVIGITGSAGKTTTTTLVGRMAGAALGAERTWVGGNIGSPLIAEVDHMQADHLVVMELSSFQLEIMSRSPQVAAVLNVTPNHLDRHMTMEAYTRAKAQILVHQTHRDAAVLGWQDPGAWALREQVRGDLYLFGFRRPPSGHPGAYLQDDVISLWDGHSWVELFSRDVLKLKGEHNLGNVLAACALAYAAGLPPEAMQVGVKDFSGVEHRLEFVRSWGGADWYNDSIATAPERAIAAIQSFEQPLVLLAGGRDKNLPWEKLAAFIHQKVDHLIIFGEAREIVSRAVAAQPAGDRPFSIDICESLENALQCAAQRVEPGDVVLLSPGGTSFDEFRDFAERGEWFRTWVNKLP
jgi:UDP-N-acetylmuramoylalanine--D-glutamate ligase